MMRSKCGSMCRRTHLSRKAHHLENHVHNISPTSFSVYTSSVLPTAFSSTRGSEIRVACRKWLQYVGAVLIFDTDRGQYATHARLHDYEGAAIYGCRGAGVHVVCLCLRVWLWDCCALEQTACSAFGFLHIVARSAFDET